MVYREPWDRDARVRARAASGGSVSPFAKVSANLAAPSAAVAAAVARSTSRRSAGGSGAPVAARAAAAEPRRRAAASESSAMAWAAARPSKGEGDGPWVARGESRFIARVLVGQRAPRVAAQLGDEAQLRHDQCVGSVETDLAVPVQDRAQPRLGLVEQPLAARAESEPQLRVDLARAEAEFGGEAPGPLVVLPAAFALATAALVAALLRHVPPIGATAPAETPPEPKPEPERKPEPGPSPESARPAALSPGRPSR
ncbi:hypothetical protein [Streptomyces sp. enrichment culture]|uniref:hypothetical protein n=1 Tax=Streptomyces sp. enrichment culture TaxID=1795815 RepID=UPI003F56CC29